MTELTAKASAQFSIITVYFDKPLSAPIQELLPELLLFARWPVSAGDRKVSESSSPGSLDEAASDPGWAVGVGNGELGELSPQTK